MYVNINTFDNAKQINDKILMTAFSGAPIVVLSFKSTNDNIIIYTARQELNFNYNQQTQILDISSVAQNDKTVTINFIQNRSNNYYQYKLPLKINLSNFEKDNNMNDIKSQLKDKLSFADRCKWSLKDIGRSFCGCCIKD